MFALQKRRGNNCVHRISSYMNESVLLGSKPLDMPLVRVTSGIRHSGPGCSVVWIGSQ